MAKKRGPTNRQRLLVKGLAKGKTQRQAAIDAGYTTKHPDVAAHQALQQIAKTQPTLLERHGLSDDVLIKKYLVPLMRAERSVFAVSEGEFTDERKRPDWSARKDGLDISMKIRGLYVKEREDSGPQFTVLIINASNRPNWQAMKKAQINVPGLDVAPPTGE